MMIPNLKDSKEKYNLIDDTISDTIILTLLYIPEIQKKLLIQDS